MLIVLRTCFALGLLFGMSCNGCRDEPAVPFKRGSFQASGAQPGAKDGGVPAASAAAVPGRAGATYPPQTHQITIGGAALSVKEQSLRAGLEVGPEGRAVDAL